MCRGFEPVSDSRHGGLIVEDNRSQPIELVHCRKSHSRGRQLALAHHYLPRKTPIGFHSQVSEGANENCGLLAGYCQSSSERQCVICMSPVLVRVVECVLEALVATHSPRPSTAFRDLKGKWVELLLAGHSSPPFRSLYGQRSFLCPTN